MVNEKKIINCFWMLWMKKSSNLDDDDDETRQEENFIFPSFDDEIGIIFFVENMKLRVWT